MSSTRNMNMLFINKKFIKHFVPDTVPGTGDTAVNNIGKALILLGLILWWDKQ